MNNLNDTDLQRLREHIIAIHGEKFSLYGVSLLALIDEIAALRKERDELQASFDRHWDINMAAIKRGRDAHPGNDLALPDAAALVEWLMKEWDALRKDLPTQPTKGTP